MLGELLGARYRIIDVLGSGGFGHTYIAEDTQRPGHPRCVLKHLTFASPNTVILKQVRRLFQAEAETLERLGRHDQIPRLLAYFEQNHEFYLIQEFIPGHPLSEELVGGKRFSEYQVILLLEDVLGILEYVHAQGVIHRDIKPDNLIRRPDQRLVLIDFGAVKTIGNTIAESTGDTSYSIPIYTSGYASSEQCCGRPQFSSDLFSLGMVAIQSLTGMRPSQLPQDLNSGEIIWRDQADVSEELADVLDKMTCFHFSQRYQSATEALNAVRQVISDTPRSSTSPRPSDEPTIAQDTTQIANSTAHAARTRISPPNSRQRRRNRRWRRRLPSLVVGLVGVGAIGLLGRSFLPLPAPSPNPTPSLSATGDRISRGEKLLNRWVGSATAYPDKQAGVEQIARQNFALAIRFLEAARQRDRSDPETLIYLNNARIGANKAYTIAVVVPLGDVSGTAKELLRGVAQAQEQVNQAGGMNGVPLRVAIANDDNDPAIAQGIAQELVKNPDVLAVVGHSTSDASLAAAAVYQANQVVMVSPLSSAVQLSNYGPFIFRTMPSDRMTAKALSDYMLTRLKKRKVVVFYNSTSAYSRSLKTEFKDALFYNGVEPLGEFDLSRPDFDAYEGVKQTIAQGAEVMMLAPDHRTSDRSIQLVQVNRGRLKLLTGDSIYTSKLLQIGGETAVGMVLAVPAGVPHPTFRQQHTQLWGTSTSLNWRTTLAYDAAEALIAALQKDPARTAIQRVLSQPEFAAKGAQGSVSFLPSGDRQGTVRLVTVAPTRTKPPSYEFRPLP